VNVVNEGDNTFIRFCRSVKTSGIFK